MAVSATELIAESRCYACYGEVSEAQLLSLGLERRILLERNPTADVSAAALLGYAKCYGCYGASIYDLLELALLDQIAQA